jgi:hypothetical protein
MPPQRSKCSLRCFSTRRFDAHVSSSFEAQGFSWCGKRFLRVIDIRELHILVNVDDSSVPRLVSA